MDEYLIMNGSFYDRLLRDVFHAKGLHECPICCIDIDQDFEHDFKAYPVSEYFGHSKYLNSSLYVMSGFMCERCYSEKIKEEKNNENN